MIGVTVLLEHEPTELLSDQIRRGVQRRDRRRNSHGGVILRAHRLLERCGRVRAVFGGGPVGAQLLNLLAELPHARLVCRQLSPMVG
jgi:hypothetical protein